MLKFKLVAFLILANSFFLKSQTIAQGPQKAIWYLDQFAIEFPTTTSSAFSPQFQALPSVNPVVNSGLVVNHPETSNGYYNKNGTLMFYTSYNQSQEELQIKDSAGTVVGSLPSQNGWFGAELAVIPFPCSLSRFVILHDWRKEQTGGGNTIRTAALGFGIYNKGGTVGFQQPITNQSQYDEYENHGIAVSPIRYSHLGYDYRHIYVTSGKTIKRYTLDYSKTGADMILSKVPTDIFTVPHIIDPVEVELSHDARQLAWSDANSNDIYILQLNHNGDVISSEKVATPWSSMSVVDIQNAGIEFSANGEKLFISRVVKGPKLHLSGIYTYDIKTKQTRLSGPVNKYGQTFLELAPDGKVYGLNAKSLIGINQDGVGFTTLPIPSNYTAPFTQSPSGMYSNPKPKMYYRLPDQIDGELIYRDHNEFEPDLANLSGSVCRHQAFFEIPPAVTHYDLTLKQGNNPDIILTGWGGERVFLNEIEGLECGVPIQMELYLRLFSCADTGFGVTNAKEKLFQLPSFTIDCNPEPLQVKVDGFNFCKTQTATAQILNNYNSNYSTVWSGDNGFYSANQMSVSGLTSGNYSVGVVHNTTGCYETYQFSLPECEQATISISSVNKIDMDPLQIFYSSNGEMVFENVDIKATGKAEIISSEGKMIYSSKIRGNKIKVRPLPRGKFWVHYINSENRRMTAVLDTSEKTTVKVKEAKGKQELMRKME